MTDTVHRDCSCGGSLRATSTPESAAVGIAAVFDEMHSGDGHAPVTPRESARARAAEQRQFAGEIQ